MKTTEIIRRIDDLDKVVISKEICGTYRIEENDPLKIFKDQIARLLGVNNEKEGR